MLRPSLHLVVVLLLGGLAGCQHNASREDAGFLSDGKHVARSVEPLVRDYVFRDETLATARWYAEMEWIPGEQNRFHGLDRRGVRVDTPDAAFTGEGGLRPGWKPGELHIGMPYHWGGFATPLEFLKGLEEARPAGDMYTASKRAGLDKAVSDFPVGIDCSGFVSRCWKLPKPFSTRELPALCDSLPNHADLKAGDILNLSNNHVILFERFNDDERTEIIGYEAGSPISFSVGRHRLNTLQLAKLGYQAYRYRGIRERGAK